MSIYEIGFFRFLLLYMVFPGCSIGAISGLIQLMNSRKNADQLFTRLMEYRQQKQNSIEQDAELTVTIRKTETDLAFFEKQEKRAFLLLMFCGTGALASAGFYLMLYFSEPQGAF